MNDTERELWVMNDEGLYMWWKSERTSVRKFVRGNRKEIDTTIEAATSAPPPRALGFFRAHIEVVIVR